MRVLGKATCIACGNRDTVREGEVTVGGHLLARWRCCVAACGRTFHVPAMRLYRVQQP